MYIFTHDSCGGTDIVGLYYMGGGCSVLDLDNRRSIPPCRLCLLCTISLDRQAADLGGKP